MAVHKKTLVLLSLLLQALLLSAVLLELDLDACEIQGSGLASPYVSNYVRTRGTVTYDRDTTGEKGFFIQHPNCDGDPATSDALFVYIGQKTDVVAVGDYVEVEGWVNEFYGLTEVSALPQNVAVLESRPIPSAAVFAPPKGAGASKAYFEAHEGMRVRIADALVVGPTTARETAYVVDAAAGAARFFPGDRAGAIVAVGPDGIFEIAPEVKVGDRVLNLVGVLDVEQGDFLLRLTAQPAVVPATYAPETGAPAGPISFAALNLHNLFDTFDDPLTADPVLTAGEYQRRLEKLALLVSDALGEPTFIAAQEAENAAVLQALANRPEISAQYGFAHADGPDVRGIDVAVLYRLDRAALQSVESRQGCTDLLDGLGPDGNLDPLHPANTHTCDLDGLPGFEGNRLFSRPPLVVELEVCPDACLGSGDRVWVIAVHLKSKSQDTPQKAHTLPRRIEQAAFVAGLAAEVLAADPGAALVVLGDFNDHPGSAPLAIIEGAGLVNLVRGVPRADRYTFNFRGISQALDHVFVSQSLVRDPLAMLAARIAHFGADYPAGLSGVEGSPVRASDHDPVRVDLLSFNQTQFLPLIQVQP